MGVIAVTTLEKSQISTHEDQCTKMPPSLLQEDVQSLLQTMHSIMNAECCFLYRTSPFSLPLN